MYSSGRVLVLLGLGATATYAEGLLLSTAGGNISARVIFELNVPNVQKDSSHLLYLGNG
jgi:hypothetical protein